MTSFRAISLIEDIEAPADDDELISAWQHLVDTGLA